jgi:hypothetical protein
VYQLAPGLLASIERVCDWEQNRWRWLEFPLLPSEAAIPPEEDAASIHAAVAMRAHFAQDDGVEARPAFVLLDAIVGLVMENTRRH